MKASELADRIVRDIDVLYSLAADGDGIAAKEFHRAIAIGVDYFGELCRQEPKTLEPIAVKSSIWPGFLTRDSDVKQDNEALLARLNLGSQSELNYSGKQWTRKTPETLIALRLIRFPQLFTRRRGEPGKVPRSRR